MNMAARGLSAGIVAASLAAFAADNVRDLDAVPNLRGEKGREGYAAFLAANPVRAFAVAEGGASGWRSGQESRAKAVGGALYNCNKPARNICRVYAINDDVVYATYADFERKSAKMVDALKGMNLTFAEYGDEEKDLHVPVATGMRRDGKYQADTPLLAEGVKTVKTPELVRMVGSAVKPILVDVAEGEDHETLPSAMWIKGAGVGLKDDAAHAEIGERLGYVLEGLAGGNKAAPLIFFCADSGCWLALNAALRARDLGYRNAMWYRGGVKAWKLARLETLAAVQYGQVQ
jgi:PQQ-dependent catabolism-associated CXXCW motif protein